MSYDDIHALIDAPAGDGAPPLARFEETLTTGYARALVLETERRRLKRRIDEAAERARVAEVSTLNERLASAESELQRLRALLSSLKTRVREARVAEQDRLAS
jgi:ABC-type phosphate transport system auxiliary subunit